jgi:putative transposase
MRRSRFSESQIVEILKQGDGGAPVAEIVRQHGISRGTYFKWKGKYARATVNELRRLRDWKRECQAQADVRRLGPRERGAQGYPRPKAVTPSAKRQAIAILVDDHRLAVWRACLGPATSRRSRVISASSGFCWPCPGKACSGSARFRTQPRNTFTCTPPGRGLPASSSPALPDQFQRLKLELPGVPPSRPHAVPPIPKEHLNRVSTEPGTAQKADP